MSNERKKAAQITWLSDKPIAPKQKGGPERDGNGVIIFKKRELRLSRIEGRETPNYSRARVTINLNNYGRVIIKEEEAYIKFPNGRLVDSSKKYCLLHAVFCLEPKWKKDQQILKEFQARKVDTAGKLNEYYPRPIKITTLKMCISQLNLIYSTHASLFHIKSRENQDGETEYCIEKSTSNINKRRNRGRKPANIKQPEKPKTPTKNKSIGLGRFGTVNFSNVDKDATLTFSDQQVPIKKNLAEIYLALARVNKKISPEQAVKEVENVRQELEGVLNKHSKPTINTTTLKIHIRNLNSFFIQESLPFYISFKGNLCGIHRIVPSTT